MGMASVLIEMLTIKIHMMFIRIPVKACSWKHRKEIEEKQREKREAEGKW